MDESRLDFFFFVLFGMAWHCEYGVLCVCLEPRRFVTFAKRGRGFYTTVFFFL